VNKRMGEEFADGIEPPAMRGLPVVVFAVFY
jgi:hypothetical protein